MPVEEALTELTQRVRERLPSNIKITELEFAGPEVVIYTDDPRAFADNGEIVKKLARELRKRIVVEARSPRSGRPREVNRRNKRYRARRGWYYKPLF